MKTPLLFIEKDENILGNSGKIISELEKEYQLIIVRNFADALQEIKKNEIDIVFTDLQVDEKNDILLLQNIRANYPHIFVVLCTTEDRLHVNELFHLSHQIISEPITYEKLKNSFARKKRMSKYLHDGKLMGLINNISELPNLPETYIKIENEIASNNISIYKIAEIISGSVTFTAKIFRIVNSTFFGVEYKVSNVIQAINLLGVNVLKSLLLYDHISTGLIANSQYSKYFEDLWIHCNKVGRLSEQIIYLTLDKDYTMMEQAYIAGLMHDIGKVVMLCVDEYPKDVFDYMEKHNTRFSNAEYKLYGVSHAEVGAYFLSLWGFSDRSAESVYLHNNPDQLDLERFSVQSGVYIANALANDDEMNLSKLKELNLGVHPAEWIKYLEENNLLKN